MEKNFRTGDIIMRQGDAGRCAWLIQSGRVAIVVQREQGDALQVGSRGPGSIIGEMALVDDQPRSATVRAIEDCTLLEITKDDYTRSVRTAHPIVQLISQVILARYRDVLGRSPWLADVAASQLEEQERVYAELSNVADAVRMTNEFKMAIASGQLRLHYQPILDFASGRIMGFEALMRWRHPLRGDVPPSDFVPMAEDSGLIVEAGRWALREACEALGRIDAACPGVAGRLFMSVNFSAPDFEDEAFLGNFMHTLRDTGIHPSRIHLEIVERILIRQSDDVRNLLARFREAGVVVAIDDFGTGYSSLSYLHQYPIDILKIDQSFIREMREDDMSLRLVRSVLTLSRDMGMKTIAEGVETAAQAALLKEMNCDMAQGFHYARPVAEAEVITLLRDELYHLSHA